MGMFEELMFAYHTYANEINTRGLYADAFRGEQIRKFGKYLHAVEALGDFYRRNAAYLPEKSGSSDGRRFLQDLTTVGDVACNTQLNALPQSEGEALVNAKNRAEYSLFSGAMLFYDDAAKLMSAKKGGFDAEDVKCLAAVGELYDAFGFESIGNEPLKGAGGMTQKQQFPDSVTNRKKVLDNAAKVQKKLPKDGRTEQERDQEYYDRLYQGYSAYDLKNREMETRLEREAKERQEQEEKRRREREEAQRKLDEENETKRKLEAEQEKARIEQEKRDNALKQEQEREEARKKLPLRTEFLYDLTYFGRDGATQVKLSTSVTESQRKETGNILYKVFTAAWDVIRKITVHITGTQAEVLNETMQQIDDIVQNKTEMPPYAGDFTRKLNKGMEDFLRDTDPSLIFEDENGFKALKQMNELITFNSRQGQKLDENKAEYEKWKAKAGIRQDDPSAQEPSAGAQSEGQNAENAVGQDVEGQNAGEPKSDGQNEEVEYSFIEDDLNVEGERYSEVDDLLKEQIEIIDEEQNNEKKDNTENIVEDNAEQNDGKELEQSDGGEAGRKSGAGQPDAETVENPVEGESVAEQQPSEPLTDEELRSETDKQGAQKTAAQYAADLRTLLEKTPYEDRLAKLKQEMIDNRELLHGTAKDRAVDFDQQMPMTALLTRLMIVEQQLRAGEQINETEREFRDSMPVGAFQLPTQLGLLLRGEMTEAFLNELSPDDSPLYRAAAGLKTGGMMKAVDYALNSEPFHALGKLLCDGTETPEDRHDMLYRRFRVLGSIHTLLTNKDYNNEVQKPMLGTSDPGKFADVCAAIGTLAAPYLNEGREVTLGRDEVLAARKTIETYLLKNAVPSAPYLEERFERVMGAYACLCKPEELADFCARINQARQLPPEAQHTHAKYADPRDYDLSRYEEYTAPRMPAKKLLANTEAKLKSQKAGSKPDVKLNAAKYAVLALSVRQGVPDSHVLISQRELMQNAKTLSESKSFCESLNKSPKEILATARIALDPSLAPKTKHVTEQVTISRLKEIKDYRQDVEDKYNEERARIPESDTTRRVELYENYVVKQRLGTWMASRELDGGMGKVDPVRIDVYADYLLNHYRKKENGEVSVKRAGELSVAMQNDYDAGRFFNNAVTEMERYANRNGMEGDEAERIVQQQKTVTTGGVPLIDPTFGL